MRNGEKYIGTAVRSVLRYLPRDAELRILDDGSSDSTPDLIGSWSVADRRVKTTCHSQSRGLPASLNELVAAGDSDFVARMDADDVCLPSRWVLGEKMLKSVAFAFTSVVLIDGRGLPFGIDLPGQFSPVALPYHLLLGCGVVHPTAMFRREAIERVGGYQQTAAEDYDLWMRAAVAGESLMRSMAPGLAYRRHRSQVTGVAPWNEEGKSDVLWNSYNALASTIIEIPEEDLRRAFPAILHGSAPRRSQVDATIRMMSAIEHRSAQVHGTVDHSIMRVKLSGMRRRLRKQQAHP